MIVIILKIRFCLINRLLTIISNELSKKLSNFSFLRNSISITKEKKNQMLHNNKFNCSQTVN